MKNYPILLFCLMLFACQNSPNESMSAAYPESKEASYDQEMQPPNTSEPEPVERKIIKSAEIRFQVNDLKATSKKIESFTDLYNGFISNMNQTNSNYSINNHITVRLPADKLDQFISDIEKESIHTNYTRISSQDVTEEFLDISTRLKTKKDVRDRYIDILRNKAKTVKDVLDAEDKIRVIQEEIESIEGRLKYLKNKTSMSTIVIDIYQEVEYVAAPGVYKKSFFSKLKEGFLNGWELIQNLAIGLVTIWPIVLILILLFVGRNRIRGSFRRGGNGS